MSIIKVGVVCWEADCWVICSWAFKQCAKIIFMHSRSLENLRMYLSSLQDVDYHGFCFKKIFP